MIQLSFIYIVCVIFIACVFGFIINAKKRNIIITISTTLIAIPILFVGFLIIFQEPIQQGKILKHSSLGPLLNLVSPPSDLYDSLYFVKLEPQKMVYTFDFKHKYLGNHALKISSPKPSKEEQPNYSDISATLVVSDGERELFQKGSKIQGQFWGQNDYGALFVCYKVPGDLPVNRH